MNTIQPPSNLDAFASDRLQTKRARTINFDLPLLSELAEYLKSFLTGKEIACLNATSSTLNHSSWFSTFHMFEAKRLAEYEKKLQPSKAVHVKRVIRIKAMIGDFTAIPKLAAKLNSAERIKVYHQIAKFPAALPFLKKAIAPFDCNTEAVPYLKFSLDLLKYKISPTLEKFFCLNLTSLINNFDTTTNPSAMFHWSDMCSTIIDALSQSLRRMPEHLLAKGYDQHLKFLNQTGYLHFEMEFPDIQALVERGEDERALKLLNFYEKKILNSPFGSDKTFLLFYTIARKAAINFEDALESLKNCSPNYNIKDLLFYSFSFFAKTFTAAKLLQKLPQSFFDDEETRYFFVVLTQLAQGNPIQDVKEISRNLSNIPFCVFTLCWCAREMGKDDPRLAVKYLKEAIEQAPKMDDPDRCLLNFIMVAEVSRKITF